jgi:hypothetical protein
LVDVQRDRINMNTARKHEPPHEHLAPKPRTRQCYSARW